MISFKTIRARAEKRKGPLAKDFCRVSSLPLNAVTWSDNRLVSACSAERACLVSPWFDVSVKTGVYCEIRVPQKVLLTPAAFIPVIFTAYKKEGFDPGD